MSNQEDEVVLVNGIALPCHHDRPMSPYAQTNICPRCWKGHL